MQTVRSFFDVVNENQKLAENLVWWLREVLV